MPQFISLLHLLILAVLLSSCKENKKPRAESNDNEFFAKTSPTLDLSKLENNLAQAPTSFLQSFATDEIPWQPWSPEILTLAEEAQKPIFALIGNNLEGFSRPFGQALNEIPELRDSLLKKYLCTVIDTHAYPEIADFAFILSAEQNQNITFPVIAWFSHEGNPIAWRPIGSFDSSQIKILLDSAMPMVESTWKADSNYVVTNSRLDNENRQKRLDSTLNLDSESLPRDEIFRRYARAFTSLYSSLDRDLDFLGGMIPLQSISLLSAASRSQTIVPDVRANARQAASDLTQQIIAGGLRDHLVGDYFLARQTNSWTIPVIAKSLRTNAILATTILNLGSTSENPSFTQEGLQLLKIIEQNWLAPSISTQSPPAYDHENGSFLWEIPTLSELLTPAETEFAISAFALKPDGNIPLEADPIGVYFKKNSLRLPAPTSVSEAMIDSITAKLLKHRSQKSPFLNENTLTLTDHALVLQAQVARAIITNQPQDLQIAQTHAQEILTQFSPPESPLLRLIPREGDPIPARCHDYAVLIRSLLALYQATLDESWLNHAFLLFQKAESTLLTENGLLAEVNPAEQIIPLRYHATTMIFGESSLAIMDQNLVRFDALLAHPTLRPMMNLHRKALTPNNSLSTVEHTDFLLSCALGEHPLVAVVHGSPDEARDLIRILNLPRYLPFLTLRPAQSSLLKPLNPDLPTDATITLTRENTLLGTASSPADLTTLLDQIISGQN